MAGRNFRLEFRKIEPISPQWALLPLLFKFRRKKFVKSRTSFLCQLMVCCAFGSAALAAVDAPGRVTDLNSNSWFNYFGDHPLGKSRWGVHLEGQWRRSDGIANWQQLLLRPGVNYKVNSRLLLSAGYGFIDTFQYGDFPVKARFPEHRLWQQAQLRSNTGKIVWSTRLRFENRFLGVIANRSVQSYRYENRFRALQRVTVPLKGKIFLAAYEEVFLYVAPYQSSSALDQNRAYGAIGWRWKPGWNLETGYMLQTLLQRNGRIREANNTLMLSIVSTAPFSRRE